MDGIEATSGKRLGGLAHLRQSIADILTTPIGSRVMLREYGSRLFELIDRPVNQRTIADFHAATVEALRKWEPRFKITAVKILSIRDGQLTMNLTGIYVPTGKELTLEGLVA